MEVILLVLRRRRSDGRVDMSMNGYGSMAMMKRIDTPSVEWRNVLIYLTSLLSGYVVMLVRTQLVDSC